MIDSLVRRDRTNPDFLTEKEILSNIGTFYMGGTDTTATLVTWFAYILSTQPSVVSNIRREIDTVLLAETTTPRRLQSSDFVPDRLNSLRYCDAVIKETLRLYSPASFIFAGLESEFKSKTLSNGLEILRGEEFWYVLSCVVTIRV